MPGCWLGWYCPALGGSWGVLGGAWAPGVGNSPLSVLKVMLLGGTEGPATFSNPTLGAGAAGAPSA